MPDPTRIQLQVTGEDGTAVPGRIVTLPVRLGRDPAEADLAIVDRMVSRRHARLESEGDDVVVVDLGSGNGTWVGEEQVTSRRTLAAGDVLTLGSSTLAWTAVPERPRPGPAPVAPAPRRPRSGSGAAPTFGTAWAVALDDGRLRPVPLRGLYTAWVRTARTVVALRTLLSAEDATPVARLDAHDALNAAVDALFDGDLGRLGDVAISFCAPDRPVDGFTRRVPQMRGLAVHRGARAGVVELRRHTDDDAVGVLIELVTAEDRRMVERLGAAMRTGAAAFTEHGAAVVDQAGEEVLAALKALFAAVADRDTQICRHLVDARSAPVPPATEPRSTP